MSKEILKKLSDGDTVQVFAEKDVKALIDDGFVRRATIDPAPEKGKIAVNLTARGRGAVKKADKPGKLLTEPSTA